MAKCWIMPFMPLGPFWERGEPELTTITMLVGARAHRSDPNMPYDITIQRILVIGILVVGTKKRAMLCL